MFIIDSLCGDINGLPLKYKHNNYLLVKGHGPTYISSLTLFKK